MVDKVRFLLSSVLDSGTITASTETSGLEVEHVQNTLIRRVYRSTGALSKKSEWIKFDMTSATGMDMVFIGNHSFSKTATVKWQGHATDSWASPSLDTTLTVATDTQGSEVTKLGHFYSSVESYRWWRLLVEDIGNASSSIDVGRIMAGRYIEPTRNMRDGFSLRRRDPSRVQSSDGRQGYPTTRDKYYEISYSVYNTEEPQSDQIEGIFNSVGRWKPFVIAIDPESRPHHHTCYTQFGSDIDQSQVVLKQFSLAPIRFDEKT